MTQSKKNRSSEIRLGIVGGGQLARMIALDAHAMGIQCHIFSTEITDPAAQVTQKWQAGEVSDFKALQSFAQSVDYLTFESEFVPLEVLKKLNDENKPETTNQIFPNPLLLSRLQNRLEQKQTLKDFKLPTSDFIEIKSLPDLERAYAQFGHQFVLKTQLGGYDGNGTFFSKSKKDHTKLAALVSQSKTGFIAEAFVPFHREVAMMIGRSSTGQCFHLPLVETKQTQGRCDYVTGPTRHHSLNPILKKLFKMLSKIEYVGIMGVELFDTGNILLVNELAPRVHNSGHYSQLGLNHSQFTLHILAGIGAQIPKIELTAKAFAMTNILGNSESTILIPTKLTGSLHLYGKKQNRPGRKMGHINYVGSNQKSLLKLALKERKDFRL